MNAPDAYFVYILASRRYGTLYVGICNDLSNRLSLHRSGRGSKFVSKYGVTRLVYVETYASPSEGVATRLEDSLDRARKSGLARSLASSLTAVGMGPGLRRDDTIFLASHPPQFAADINLSPHAFA